MATPTRVAKLQVQLNNDTAEDFTDVGYYVHRHGLDVVDPAGNYLARFRPDEYQRYDATKPAGMAAA